MSLAGVRLLLLPLPLLWPPAGLQLQGTGPPPARPPAAPHQLFLMIQWSLPDQPTSSMAWLMSCLLLSQWRPS